MPLRKNNYNRSLSMGELIKENFEGITPEIQGIFDDIEQDMTLKQRLELAKGLINQYFSGGQSTEKILKAINKELEDDTTSQT